MIQFKDVEKKYTSESYGVKGIDITIDEGEFVFLIGPSGSGKTTLIKMLIRDEKPTAGRIYFDDVDITHINRRKVYLLRRQIGVIFQDFKLIPDKTAYENVSFAMEAAGRKDGEIKEKVPYLLDVVGLSNKLKAFPEQLSGGEQQRVAIARAMANNPRMLIADEPTGNLDPGSAWDIVQILAKINAWGTTVLMSTHGTEIVNALNKRVIQMENGTVVRDDAEGEYEFSSSDSIDEAKEAIDSVDDEVEPKKKKTAKTIKVDLTSKVNKTQENEIDEKMRKKLSAWQESRIADADTTDTKTDDESQADTQDNEKNVEKAKEEKKPSLDRPLLNPLVKKDSTNSVGNKDKEKKVEAQPDKSKQSFSAENVYEEAAETKVSYLNVPASVISDLEEAGYETVAQILDDGPEKLAENLGVSEGEMKLIAKAVSKLADG